MATIHQNFYVENIDVVSVNFGRINIEINEQNVIVLVVNLVRTMVNTSKRDMDSVIKATL